MSLRDYLRAANLVEGAVWKDADISALKSSDSCNQLITLGRCEPRCRAEEMMGHMRTAGRLSWWRQEFVFRAAEKLPANGGFERQHLLAGVMGCKCSRLLLYMGLATPTVTSFLISQLLPLLPSIPAAFLTLSATPVLLVRSPARPDCRNWLMWSLMLSGANDFFLLGHAYLSSWELMGWKDSYACVMCYQNNNSKVSV